MKTCRSCGIPSTSEFIGLSCNGRMGHDFEPEPAQPTIRFKRLHSGAIIPEYKTAGAAGMDLHWDGTFGHRDVFNQAEIVPTPELFGTGLAVEIPEGYEGQIRPRSSLGKHGVHCYFGTIDSDYRGELLIRLQMLAGPYNHWICKGDRIAQLVIAPVARCIIQVAEDLSTTERGSGGFGSTGK